MLSGIKEHFTQRVRILIEVPRGPVHLRRAQELLQSHDWHVESPAGQEPITLQNGRAGINAEVRLFGSAVRARKAAAIIVRATAKREKVQLWVRDSERIQPMYEERTTYRVQRVPPVVNGLLQQILARWLASVDGIGTTRPLDLPGPGCAAAPVASSSPAAVAQPPG
ncbi:hypothetical protein GCM10009612_47260 [Streptomyces beijiangensis]